MNAEVIPSLLPASEGPEAPHESIGEIIRRTHNLTSQDIDRILDYQTAHGVKFGEAAVALGLVKQEDVLWALAQQFHYPYSRKGDAEVNPELVIAREPFSQQAEIFRGIRDQIIDQVFLAPDDRKRALAVVSADAGEGKSFFVANMAVALAQMGGRTLVIDADMRGPRQHEIFRVENRTGLSSALAGRFDAVQFKEVKEFPGLFILPVGVTPPNPLELLQKPIFGRFLQGLIGRFDYVLVDTPAGSEGVDARVIAANAGAVVAIARKDHTRTDALNVLLAPLVARPGVKILGAVVNEF